MKHLTRTTLKYWRIDAAGVGVCAAVTVAAYLMIIQPLATAQNLRIQQDAELSQRQDTLKKVSGTENSLRHDLTRLQKSTVENPVKLQPAQQSNQRLAGLTALAAEHELDVHEMRLLSTGTAETGTSPATPNQAFAIIRIQMSGSGTFASCAAFLHQLRQHYRDTGVSSFDLSDNPADPDSKTAFKFELTWFVAPAGQQMSSKPGGTIATAGATGR